MYCLFMEINQPLCKTPSMQQPCRILPTDEVLGIPSLKSIPYGFLCTMVM